MTNDNTKPATPLPPVRSEPLLALPEDVRSFIERVTMHLQANRSKTPEQHDAMFQTAYRLYAKYDVEGRSANHDSATGVV
jgi:hypothetical protein